MYSPPRARRIAKEVAIDYIRKFLDEQEDQLEASIDLKTGDILLGASNGSSGFEGSPLGSGSSAGRASMAYRASLSLNKPAHAGLLKSNSSLLSNSGNSGHGNTANSGNVSGPSPGPRRGSIVYKTNPRSTGFITAVLKRFRALKNFKNRKKKRIFIKYLISNQPVKLMSPSPPPAAIFEQDEANVSCETIVKHRGNRTDIYVDPAPVSWFG